MNYLKSNFKKKMIQNSILTKSVHLEPKHLNQYIKEYIFSELKFKYERTCSDDVGVIISVDEIISMDNVINKDSIVITFTVTFHAKTIKPEKDMMFFFTPTLILSKGIFGKLYDNINFFIPETYLIQSGYYFENDNFVKDNHTIDNKTEIKVKIEQLKYDTIKYNCITKLVQFKE